ncbi:MAG: single-stranded DNA-binding protein, partial [Actinomycetota bacterium]|nr:single-stranded DNA-binding protein [Actinomycetota bacterium]
LEQREYETTAGEKRNVVEIVADELGPSLRWARAEVERTQRTGPDGPPAGGGRPRGGSDSGAPTGGGHPSDPVYGDEEPF